jgi:hypothetical protein
LRALLGQGSAAQRTVVALDVALHEALFERERNALASVPLRLEAHFNTLSEAHRACVPDGADDMGRWTQADGWLSQFTQAQRAVLLAELDLRWQALRGLLGLLDQARAVPTTGSLSTALS